MMGVVNLLVTLCCPVWFDASKGKKKERKREEEGCNDREGGWRSKWRRWEGGQKLIFFHVDPTIALLYLEGIFSNA